MSKPDSADYGLLADVWEKGRVAGFSTAMRRMSDEPSAPSPVNPYKCYGHELCSAPLHVHGCYADLDGTACDDPGDHDPHCPECGSLVTDSGGRTEMRCIHAACRYVGPGVMASAENRP